MDKILPFFHCLIERKQYWNKWVRTNLLYIYIKSYRRTYTKVVNIYFLISLGIAWLVCKYDDVLFRSILLASLKLQHNKSYRYSYNYSGYPKNKTHQQYNPLYWPLFCWDNTTKRGWWVVNTGVYNSSKCVRIGGGLSPWTIKYIRLYCDFKEGDWGNR